MRASALRSTSSGKPAPSFPTRRATGSHQFTSQGASSGESPSRGLCTLEASVRTFATRSCVSKIGKDIPASIGKCNAAPAEARNAFGENGLAVPLCPEAVVTAPVAPNADAVRKMVPTLPGSCTPARTTSSGEQASPCTRRISSSVAARGATSAATPCGCSVSAIPSNRSIRSPQERNCHFGTVDEWRKAFVMPFTRLAEKHRFDAAAGAQSFLDQPHSFHADATGFRLQSAAQSHAKFLEPAIVSAGNRSRASTGGTGVPSSFDGRSHHPERSKFRVK